MKQFSNIIYTKNAASETEICNHLKKCDNNFVPILSLKVNIEQYAKKIIANAVTFEAWKNEELTGLIAAYLNDKEKKIGFITNVSVLKNSEGIGIGSALLEMCIKYAAINNYIAILLEVNKESKAAIQLYRKYGFIKNKEATRSLQMKLNLNG